MNRRDTDVLVVHCSDHRFQAGLHDFLNFGLKFDENYGLLAIRGGTQCLTFVKSLAKFSWPSRRWFHFLLDAHAPNRIVLIAHQDCGWYKSLPFFLHYVSDPRHRQEEDLRRARRVLMKDFPRLSVELYYAGWDGNDQVTMESVFP